MNQETVPLGDLCDVTGGNSAPQGDEFFVDGTVPFVRMRDLGAYHHTTCLLETRDRVNESAIRNKKLKIFEPGCILFPRSGSVALNHRAILGLRACIVSHIGILLNFREDVEPHWLYWFLVHYDMGAIAKQTTNLDLVSFADIKKIAVPLVSTAKQKRIAAEIEKQFTRLEAGLAGLRRAQANLKRYRAAVLKAACEGKLVPNEVELAKAEGRKVETGAELLERILTERRKNWTGRGQYKEPAEAQKANLPALRSGWVYASLEQLTDAMRPICYGILMPKENIPNGVPYVKVKDMKGDRIDVPALHRTTKDIAAKYRRSSLLPGDLLLAIRGTYGRVAEVPEELRGANITQDTARLGVTGLACHRFLATCLRAPECQNYFKRVARGVAVKGVNIGDVRLTPIPLPPLSEQTRIVAEVERRLSVIDELEAVVTANIQRATRLRKSILQRAFAGELIQ